MDNVNDSAKVDTVTLKAKDTGKEKDFAAPRAITLLQMKHSQWQLADDSEYTYENGELSKSDKKAKKAASSPSDTK